MNFLCQNAEESDAHWVAILSSTIHLIRRDRWLPRLWRRSPLVEISSARTVAGRVNNGLCARKMFKVPGISANRTSWRHSP